MVTVTFPAQPQPSPVPETPVTAAAETDGQGFRGVFDLLQPERTAAAGPSPPDAPLSPGEAEDAADRSSDELVGKRAAAQKTDQADAPASGSGEAPTSSAPPPAKVESVEELIVLELEPEPELPVPMDTGVPVLQAIMILTALAAPAETGHVTLPEVGEAAVPAQAVTAAQVAATSPPAAIARQSSPAAAAVLAVGDLALLPPAQVDELVEETGLFVLADPPDASARKQTLPAGMPAFWAAREAADPQPAEPEGLDLSQHSTLPRDPAAPKPPSMPQMEGTAVQSDKAAVPVAGDDSPVHQESKAALTTALVPTFAAGPSPAAPGPTSLHAAVTTALPPQVPAQIAAALAARPERPLEVRLAPVELGGLTVNLLQDGDVLRVVVQADRPETLDLLRRNGEILLGELRLAGFSGAALSFADGGGAHDRRASALLHAAPAADLPPPVPPANTQTPRPAQTAQGLDLRL